VIGRNILANALGGSWFAILTIFIIPIQIKILGVDAYGLLAFIASLQIIFSIFDLGLSPTIAREVATDNSPDLQHSRDLIQTLSFGYAAIGLLLGGALALGAGWLVTHWLNLGALPVDTAKRALQLGGLALMIRWPVSFLAGVIIGRGRFGILNLLKAASATLALFGGALVILASGSLVVFAAWVALAALVEVTLYLVVCYRLIPNLSLRPRVSRPALVQIRHYVLSVSVIGVLGIALSQTDRLLLSTLVPIEILGYYSLAFTLLSGLTLVQGFFTSALLPSFATTFAQDATERLASDHNRATQGLVYVCTLPVAALTFFGEPLLGLWTSAETAAQAARILFVLAPGFLLNVSVAIPYTLALATGHTSIIIRVYSMAFIVYLPMLYFAIVHWGGVGAAVVWLLLNISYLFSLVPLVLNRIVGQTPRYWVGRNLLPFLALGTLVFGVALAVQETLEWRGPFAIVVVCAVASLAYCLLGLRLLDPALRNGLWLLLKSLISLLRGVVELR